MFEHVRTRDQFNLKVLETVVINISH